LAGRQWKPGELLVPLDPAKFADCVWAVPLWSERGLVGALLMGEKRDGSLYAQEEMETARVMGERFIDTLAGSAVARRLMQLQRRQLAESQLLDRRARSVLHDEVLPGLHAAILLLSGAESGERQAAVKESLGEAHRRISDLLRETHSGIAPEVAKLGPLGALRQLVGGEMAEAFDGVSWKVDPQVEAVAADLPPLAAEVVYGAAREALRNAAHHGRGGLAERLLHLRISARLRDGLWIEVEDDGVGFGAGAASSRGSGRGLTLHGAMMAVAGGALSVEAAPGTGTRIVLALPMEHPT
jgi:signal transduction histidine kinase